MFISIRQPLNREVEKESFVQRDKALLEWKSDYYIIEDGYLNETQSFINGSFFMLYMLLPKIMEIDNGDEHRFEIETIS